MNQFEFAQLFRTRAEMISKGAPPTINAKGMIDPLEIAYREFQDGVVPLRVTRFKPNGTREILNANILDSSEFVTYSEAFEERRAKENYWQYFR